MESWIGYIKSIGKIFPIILFWFTEKFDPLIYSPKSISNFVLGRERRIINPLRNICSLYYCSYKTHLPVNNDWIQFESDHLLNECKGALGVDVVGRFEDLSNEDLKWPNCLYPPLANDWERKLHL